MTEDLRKESKKGGGSRIKRTPVAATSVIALASATGAHIFRRSKTIGGSLKERASSSLATNSSSNEGGRGQNGEGEERPRESRPSADSGFGGPPPSGGSILGSSDNFPMPSPVGKRHSLTVDPMPPQHQNLSGSTSLLVLPNNNEGGNPQKLMEHQNGGTMTSSKTETVELKTHLKEREKISVAKEKRAAKTIAVKITH